VRSPAPRTLPAPLALGLAGAGGVAVAAQAAANGELGQRAGGAPVAAVVNTGSGLVILLLALAALPSMRAGVTALRRTRLPWWTYAGGVLGGSFILVAAYAVPVVGVSLFTIAQVAGGSFGGLGVDRAGLAPLGRLPLTGARLAAAGLAVAAVALAQVGSAPGRLALGLILLSVAAGAAIAVQSALNGRVSVTAGTGVAALLNFSTAIVVVSAAALVARSWPRAWPGEWYLYVGGVLGVALVLTLVVSVRAVGVLRSGLALVAGQLAGAILLDALSGEHRVGWALVAGAALTVVAVAISGRGSRRPDAAP
jgi:transporter family-2 protein